MRGKKVKPNPAGDLIRSIQHVYGWDVRQLAMLIGGTCDDLEAWESGRSEPCRYAWRLLHMVYFGVVTCGFGGKMTDAEIDAAMLADGIDPETELLIQ